MHVDELIDGRHIVDFVPLHTGHDIGPNELAHLSLPNSIKEYIAIKVFHQSE